MTRIALFLALVGALAVAAGVGLRDVPLGLIVAGIEAMGAAYMIQYWEARR